VFSTTKSLHGQGSIVEDTYRVQQLWGAARRELARWAESVLKCGGKPPFYPSASLLSVISAAASKLVPPSGKSGSKLPHSKGSGKALQRLKPYGIMAV
jgi:hypothetical protein